MYLLLKGCNAILLLLEVCLGRLELVCSVCVLHCDNNAALAFDLGFHLLQLQESGTLLAQFVEFGSNVLIQELNGSHV